MAGPETTGETGGGTLVIDLLVKILVNAVAVYVAVLVVPQIAFPAANDLLSLSGDWWHVLVVALILAVVNSYLKPIVKALSFPITLLSLGLFAFVVNALLLLLVAFLSDTVGVQFTIGGFPPEFTADAFVGALLGSIVISLVATVLGLLDRGRRVI